MRDYETIREGDSCCHCSKCFENGESIYVLFGEPYHHNCLYQLSFKDLLDMARDADEFYDTEVEPCDEEKQAWIDVDEAYQRMRDERLEI